jgi:pyridoxal phosphate enzyme (YggS family)
MISVKENLLNIKSSLPNHVTLVAVSKTKPNEMLQEVYDTGHRDFGENYIQELCLKQTQLPADIRWHFIGHLQSNKVKYIAPFVHLIHGVDSLKLLVEINKQAAKNNRVIDCLLQIHIAQEETKFGLSYQECEDILQSDTLKQLNNCRVVGLMAMASNTDDQNHIRNEFKALNAFFIKQKQSATNNEDFNVLSIGMSSDYQLAIEEGSTLIRVGSSIFGNRTYA